MTVLDQTEPLAPDSAFEEEIPNEETLAAMRECEEMMKHPEKYKSYHSVEEMMRDLLS